MKNLLCSTVLLISTNLCCFSQDIITLRTGKEIQSKVIEIKNEKVKFTKFDNTNDEVYSISTSAVLMIQYENGIKDIFEEEEEKQEIVSTPKPPVIYDKSPAKNVSIPTPLSDTYFQGKTDALRYYKGYRGAGGGVLIVSLLSPLVGLVPAVACASTPPKVFNLDYPSAELMKDPSYHNGYTREAKKIKQNKVWKNWGIALGVNIVAVLLLNS